MESNETKESAIKPEKTRLTEINSYLTCYLCKGYLIDATTISECLHSFCRSCIIKFLQDNSHCPVCEVIINKAKPNLKLDKTLQDIVYKLVPGLFLKEMKNRKQFYLNHPDVAAKVTPEERGEDTERTIFNPQDSISLSIEYISDDSTPGAIRLPTDQEKSKNERDDGTDTQIKRYLQCPGMCRIEVLKKFVRNKYSVDTSKFHIEILYKRVPLPDHYTLIDIAYIYSWKRNEPMIFYFRITDINVVAERFDYFDGKSHPELVVKVPLRPRYIERTKKRESLAQKRAQKSSKLPMCPPLIVEDQCPKTVLPPVESERENKVKNQKCDDVKSDDNKSDVKSDQAPELVTKNEENVVSDSAKNVKVDEQTKTKHVTSSENVKTPVANEKKNVYTNITLDRTNNMEIITKIQKVSNKDGQPIGLNIIKQTVKKTANNNNNNNNNVPAKPPEDIKVEIDEEKTKFLRSIELTAKTLLPMKPLEPIKKPEIPSLPITHKRKNSSPIKNDKSKKMKVEKKQTPKIILQSKVPTTSSMIKSSQKPLQNFLGECKINIPSSLSITLKDSAAGDISSMPVPPVKNYIEILKIPEDRSNKEEDSDQMIDEDISKIAKSLTEKIPVSTTISQTFGPKNHFQIPVKTLPKYPNQPAPVPDPASCKLLTTSKSEAKVNSPRSAFQSYQKIFEDSIKKPSPSKSSDSAESGNEKINPPHKRNMSDIITELSKKNQIVVDSNKKEIKIETKKPEVTPKVAIPRLPNHRKPKITKSKEKLSQMDNLHSNTLGLKYSISVDQNLVNNAAKKPKLTPDKLPEVKSPEKFNGFTSPVKSPGELTIVLPNEETKEHKDNKIETPVFSSKVSDIAVTPSSSPKLPLKPTAIPKNLSPHFGGMSPRNSPRHQSPKSSPVVKHMYAPLPTLRIPSPNTGTIPTVKSKNGSPKPPSQTTSPKVTKHVKSATNSPNSSLTPNQILEKYNIQNLAQLTAGMSPFGLTTNPQLAALQHAMLLKHFELQNQQNWAPLLQYEKYLQSLNGNQNQIVSNIKEN